MHAGGSKQVIHGCGAGQRQCPGFGGHACSGPQINFAEAGFICFNQARFGSLSRLPFFYSSAPGELN